MTNIDHDKIEELISDGYIKKNYHKNGKLFMYTYTTKTQYENMWVPETIMCRGIIFDLNKNLIARPFPKFFNLNQYNDDIPLEPFTVYEKVDGSLGILYFHEEKPYIATKGSFDSDQALIATDMLHKMYTDSISYINKDYTYLFEIIYPENRIIVNYGDKKSLTLLGVIDTSSGKECESLTGISFLEMLSLENAGLFPRKIMYGINKQFVGWVESDIFHWKKVHKDYMVPPGYIGNGLFEKECMHLKLATIDSDIPAVCGCIDCSKKRYDERNASKMTSSDDHTATKQDVLV